MLLERPTAQQRRAHKDRERNGTAVLFNGATYYVYAKKSTMSDTGASDLKADVFGVFLAAAAPRVFNFSPLDFAPFTVVEPPQEGAVVVWMGWNYLITKPDVSNLGDSTVDLLMYGFRMIDGQRAVD